MILFMVQVVFGQSEPIAGVRVANETSTTSSHLNAVSSEYSYNSMDHSIKVIPWKKEINVIMDAIDKHHFKLRSLEELNQVLINGTLNSFDLYASINQEEKTYLESRFRAFFDRESFPNVIQYINQNHPQPDQYLPVNRDEETGKIEVDENYFSWLEEHVFRQSRAKEIFQHEVDAYKYAALLHGIAQVLDPNSWFTFDSASYARASNLIDGQNSPSSQTVSQQENKSVFSRPHRFGKVSLQDRVLWVRFSHELGMDASDSLLSILSEYQNSYDSVVYDFRNTLGGIRAEFEHILEPFIALEEQDILMASFFDRQGYESLPERMLIRKQGSIQRSWQEPAINKTLLVYTSPVSSSGAEIVAMAVQDLGLGVVVGQRSSGKTTAAESYLVGPLAFWLTQYKFFGPKGTSPKGIKPDLELYLEDEKSYLRNYEKQFAINYPQQLSHEQLNGVYNSSQLWFVDFEEKRTALQEAIQASFLKHRKFKTALKSKELDQDHLIKFIIKVLNTYCEREQLVSRCDVETMNETIAAYFE
ncbi:MAG TPA: S41 family peptidase [Oligoflexia bacterium]|nr:S41 family peptidase [Oligoflexia bacterium]